MSNFNTMESIIRNVNKSKPDAYNILTFPTHERYETQLCKTGHNFYSFHLPNLKKWNKDQTLPPENYYILPEQSVCEYIKYDMILVQSKFWQYQVAQKLNDMLNLPIICLEHTLPTPQTIPPENIFQMKSMLGDVNVFISKYSQDAWGINYNTTVIHHGIDSEAFKPIDIDKDGSVLTVANDFVKRDYCLNYSGWRRVTTGLPVRLVGDTKGLSKSASSTEELVSEYNKCSVYFNSTTLSPIPTTLLEAMSCGCAVVSTATCMIPEIIENGVNGFISNNETELRSYIDILLKDKELASRIGAKARETILNNFGESKFINQWNNLFDKVYEVSTR